MKLYISDLDGTLLNDDAKLSDKTVKILNELIHNGEKITIATARSIATAKKILQPLDINIPVIFLNGIQVYDPILGCYLNSHYLNSETAYCAIELYEKHGFHPFVYCIDVNKEEKIFYKGVNNNAQQMFMDVRIKTGDKRFTKVASYPDLYKYNILHINILADKSRLELLYKDISLIPHINIHFYEDVYYKDYFFLDVLNASANKQNGLKFLKDLLKPSKVVCFGDNVNDLPLFYESDVKIAVSNAHPLVLQEADIIIGSNNDDSVAKYIYSDCL